MHITSDRDTKFTAKFWKFRCQKLQIKARMSTACQLEGHGQTERLNAVMEQYLRGNVSYQQKGWAEWLPIHDFASNNQVSVATKSTPFFGNYGYHPRFNHGLQPTDQNSQAMDTHKFAQMIMDIQNYL